MGDWDSFELFVIEQKQRIGNWTEYKQTCNFACPDVHICTPRLTNLSG